MYINFEFHILLATSSAQENVLRLLSQVPEVRCFTYRTAEELVASCPALPCSLIFEYEVNGVKADDYIYELALQAGWSEIPWVLVAPETLLLPAKNLQSMLPQIVDVVDPATTPAQWEPVLEKLINHFASVPDEPEAPVAATLPVPASAPVPVETPLESFRKKMTGHPAVEDFFIWDVADDQIETSSARALQYKEEAQFALTMVSKISEELPLGEILEIHVLAPNRSGVVFSVQLSLPDSKAHAIGLIAKRGGETRAVVAGLRN